MNILFVNNHRGRGGGEEFLRDLLPGLAQNGTKVGLVCRPKTPLSEMFGPEDVAVHPVERSGVGALTSVFEIAAIIRRDGYNIINIQRSHDIIQSWIAAMLSGRRPLLIYTPQVPEFIESRFLLGRMDHIVTISRYIRDRLVSFHPPLAEKVSIIYYGIDLKRFTPRPRSGLLRGRFNIPDDTFIIGTVGDLWKNQIEFLDALVEIRKRFPDTRYALVASDSGIGQVKEFKDRVSRLGLDDAVLWAGRLSKEDMLSFYADIDIAVSTHRNEGFGIWILEALAMGRPVVAFDAGGVRDSLTGCPAAMLIKGDARDMADGIIKILSEPFFLNRMGIHGPKWIAEKFSRERMVMDYLRLFESIVRRQAS